MFQAWRILRGVLWLFVMMKRDGGEGGGERSKKSNFSVT